MRAAIRETDAISFKLLGLVPLVSGAALIGLILQTHDLPAGLLVVLSLFAATITLGLFRWELRNVQTCSWLLGLADALEARGFGQGGMHEAYRSRPAPPQGVGKSEAEKLIYATTIAAWLALPLGLGAALPQPFFTAYILLAALIAAATIASLFAAPRMPPAVLPDAGSAPSLRERAEAAEAFRSLNTPTPFEGAAP